MWLIFYSIVIYVKHIYAQKSKIQMERSVIMKERKEHYPYKIRVTRVGWFTGMSWEIADKIDDIIFRFKCWRSQKKKT